MTGENIVDALLLVWGSAFGIWLAVRAVTELILAGSDRPKEVRRDRRSGDH